MLPPASGLFSKGSGTLSWGNNPSLSTEYLISLPCVHKYIPSFPILLIIWKPIEVYPGNQALFMHKFNILRMITLNVIPLSSQMMCWQFCSLCFLKFVFLVMYSMSQRKCECQLYEGVSMVRSIDCSCKESKFSFQHPSWPDHNHL